MNVLTVEPVLVASSRETGKFGCHRPSLVNFLPQPPVVNTMGLYSVISHAISKITKEDTTNVRTLDKWSRRVTGLEQDLKKSQDIAKSVPIPVYISSLISCSITGCGNSKLSLRMSWSDSQAPK